jgi:hypothetical protein
MKDSEFYVESEYGIQSCLCALHRGEYRDENSRIFIMGILRTPFLHHSERVHLHFAFFYQGTFFDQTRKTYIYI